jgi:hypothetical protein
MYESASDSIISKLNEQLMLADEDAEEVPPDERDINESSLIDKYKLNADGSIESAESSCALGTVTPPPVDLCSCECSQKLFQLPVRRITHIRSRRFAPN